PVSFRAPINLYHLLVDFKVFKHNFKIFIVCHWLAMSSVCITHSYTAITTPRTELWLRSHSNAYSGALSTIRFSRLREVRSVRTTRARIPYGTALSIPSVTPSGSKC
ncbi:unnamed protein product, partial [Oppiella nova]